MIAVEWKQRIDVRVRHGRRIGGRFAEVENDGVVAVDADGGRQTGERQRITADATAEIHDQIVVAVRHPSRSMPGDRVRSRLLEPGAVEEHPIGVGELDSRPDSKQGGFGDRRGEVRIVTGSQVGDDIHENIDIYPQVALGQSARDKPVDLAGRGLGAKSLDQALVHAAGIEKAISAKTTHST